jgi:hypothetical protein
MKFKILTIFSIFSTFLFGQESCGTKANREYLDLINTQLKSGKTLDDDDMSYADLSISLFVVSTDESVMNIYTNGFSYALDSLNKIFKPINISFTLCKTTMIREIEYDSITSKEIEDEVTGLYSDVNIINVYIAGAVSPNGGENVCGYAYLPTGSNDYNYIFLAKNCNEAGTLIHEMGHFFGLLHPHETEFGAELVDGSNCETAGDLICDTYASPNLISLTNDCEYIGTGSDANKAFYTPQVSNIMSYSPKECRCTFTQGQYDWMRKNYFLFRKGLR